MRRFARCAIAHDAYPVGHHERLFLVVRDVERRSPELAVEAADLEHLLAQLPVQRAQWLVHQEHCRLDDHRPCQRDALLLATDSCSMRRRP